MNSARITTPAIEALVADDRRVVPLFAVHNFRDLGGYPTADGRETRWRTLFRAGFVSIDTRRHPVGR
jgi:hypothetical protein